ncbi:MAG: BTAD domain-containing putative transcriptional regulator, partial [Acidimicrobiia bacterium]
MTLEIRVLGPLEVEVDDVSSLDRPSHRRLLSIFALDAGQRIGTEVLVDRFWGGEPPPTAKAAIQTHVSALRRILGDGHIVTEGYGYRLDADRTSLDRAKFDNVTSAAHAAAVEHRAEDLLDSVVAALGLWRGTPYAELVDDDFARAEIAKLTEIHLELYELRAEALIALGRIEEALPDLEALVVEHPFRERLWEHLMTARYRLGRNADALRAYQDLSANLAEIGVEPGEPLRRLEEKILLHDKSLTHAKHNLPTELDSFIGREIEISEVKELLANNRLVTLTGPGGSGKTRLAVHLARQLLDEYPDGIWFVELAALRDPELISTEVVRIIGLSPSDDPTGLLERALANDTALIILDNCEHILERVSDLVTSILRSSPHVGLIATSREPLRVPGEAVYEVPGMTLPDNETPTPTATDQSDAVQLFRSRAGPATRSFDTDPDSESAIVEICRRLDGMPLAIELAAARAASLAPRVIASRLDTRFELLTSGSATAPPRQQTLEATIDWSYQLLSHEEQRVLRQLGVFRGGFDLDMAEYVCSGLTNGSVVPVISDLVSKSLVSRYKPGIGHRYRLLESVREFALLALQEADVLEEARQHHLRWSVEFGNGIRHRIYRADRESLGARIRLEADNLLAALEFADQTDNGVAAGILAEALERHWFALDQNSRAVEATERAIEERRDAPSQAYLNARLSDLLFWANDPDGSVTRAELAYRLAQDVEPSLEKMVAISTLSETYLINVGQDPARARTVAQEALEIALTLGEPLLEVVARRIVANSLAWNGDTKAGIEEAQLALQIAKGSGDPGWILECQQWLLHVLYMDPVARRDRPGQVVEELMAEFDEHDPRWVDKLSRGWFQWALIQTGHLARAERSQDELEERRHLEGWAFVELRIVRATARWMQGRLHEAKQDVLDAEREGVNPRWYHDYYPLRVDILSDLGELEEARASADFYLNADVHPSEEIKKVGALNPIVRAEIDRALSSSETREEHIA